SGGAGGSAPGQATGSATAIASPAGSRTAARKPKCAASGGNPSAATPTPSGWAVWRIPIATPRSDFANQPITTRPLAAFTDAVQAPAAKNTPKRSPTGWVPTPA